MADMMTFPDTVEEFMEEYKLVDTEQVYTNGMELVPMFRMKQWFEHEKAQLSQEGTTSDLISKFIDDLEEIFAHIREKHVDDSVCGLCEYDGAYIGQSGDWCNECPGFNRDDCFKLSDKTRRKWTEEIITICKHVGNNSEIPNSSDSVSRQQEIDALDTAIEHYDGIAEECRKKANIERNDYMDMRDDAYEARQLAQWLNELKYLREKIEQLTIQPEEREEVLRSLPSAQPETKKGEWSDGYRWQRCSLCKQTGKKSWNYCPNCGADMRGKKDG